MSYNPATDFVAIIRNPGTSPQAGSLPGLDFAIDALARAGAINVQIGGPAPTSNQLTTAWFVLQANSYGGEGTFMLWNAASQTYVGATPGLFALLVEATGKTAGLAAVSDTNYAAKATDRFITFKTLTAPRVVTMPALAQFPVGTEVSIADESSNASIATPITVTGGTFGNGIGPAIIAAYGSITLKAGATRWLVR